MSDLFLGVDFANRATHLGRCVISREHSSLVVYLPKEVRPTKDFSRVAVDCPFGTAQGFEDVLCGEGRNISSRLLKYRETEEHIKDEISKYDIIQDWERCRKGALFNSGSHIKASVGLVIVPECLQWIPTQLELTTREQRHHALQESRLGVGRIVEAHPRMFLYSALEMVRRSTRQRLSTALATAARDYKKANAVGVESRESLLSFLTANSCRILSSSMHLMFAEGVEPILVANDHAFDAMLCALTAVCHSMGQTKTWDEFGILEAKVRTEGHMLILRQSQGS